LAKCSKVRESDITSVCVFLGVTALLLVPHYIGATLHGAGGCAALVLEAVLGEGTFGKVFKGEAVKSLMYVSVYVSPHFCWCHTASCTCTLSLQGVSATADISKKCRCT
jgi:hypothetical protein